MPQAKLCNCSHETVLKSRHVHGVASIGRDGTRVWHARTMGYLGDLRAQFSCRCMLPRMLCKVPAWHGLVTRALCQADQLR